MPWRLQSEPTVAEKICGGLSYFTFGIVGMIYMLFFSKNGTQSQLFRFHFFQAIILSIIAMLIQMAAGPLLSILFNIIGAVAPGIAMSLGHGLDLTTWVISSIYSLVLLYGAIMAFLGKFAEVPFISNVVRQNMRA